MKVSKGSMGRYLSTKVGRQHAAKRASSLLFQVALHLVVGLVVLVVGLKWHHGEVLVVEGREAARCRYSTLSTHSAVYTHSTLYTLHSALYNLHSSLYTLHCALYSLHGCFGGVVVALKRVDGVLVNKRREAARCEKMDLFTIHTLNLDFERGSPGRRGCAVQSRSKTSSKGAKKGRQLEG